MQSRLPALLLAFFLLPSLTLPAFAQNADPKIEFEKYSLPSGMEVILHQDRTVPLVAVSVWYHVGSGDEVPGKSGFAHLFEHMMFQGAQHIGEDVHFDILKKIGASGINGTTSTDRTNYYETVPSHQLETALWLESDRMGYMLPLLNEKSLANQREVVRNERRQRVDNVPYGKSYMRALELLYPEGHPYRYSVIGRHEDLAGASAEDVRTFFQKWYVPANATLVLAGDFDEAEAKKLVEKWFGSFPASTKPIHRDVPPPVITKVARETLNDGFARLRRIHYAWIGPKYYAPGDADLDILASALGDSGTGRLYKILVHEKQLAQSVSASNSSAQLNGTFNVMVDLKSDADMAEVEKIIQAEIDRVMAEPITQREFDRAVIGIESSYVWGLESLGARAETLQSYNHYVGRPDYITQDLDRYRKTTPEKVRDAAKKFLGKNNRVEVVTMPAPQSAEAPVKGAK